MTIRRFELIGRDAGTELSPDGDYVIYDDHAEIVSALMLRLSQRDALAPITLDQLMSDGAARYDWDGTPNPNGKYEFISQLREIPK